VSTSIVTPVKHLKKNPGKAAGEGQADVVKVLLDHHADVNASRTDIGATALHLAADN